MDIEFEQEIRRSIHRGLREIEKDRVARQQVLREAEEALRIHLELEALRRDIVQANTIQATKIDGALGVHFKILGKAGHSELCPLCNKCRSCSRKLLDEVVYHA